MTRHIDNGRITMDLTASYMSNEEIKEAPMPFKIA